MVKGRLGRENQNFPCRSLEEGALTAFGPPSRLARESNCGESSGFPESRPSDHLLMSRQCAATMSTSTYDNVLFGSAAAVRLLLPWAFPGLPDLLSGRVELSTPVTGFKRCMRLLTPRSQKESRAELPFCYSAGRSVSIRPRIVPLRRRCLPPGSSAAAALLAPP